ncbi:ATP-dependent DNA helicase MER3 [Coemansia sp. BCRC 34301]|nr:ATP-dependent DNA helicase MER3 [Coemansia sp. BCRC 34301]
MATPPIDAAAAPLDTTSSIGNTSKYFVTKRPRAYPPTFSNARLPFHVPTSQTTLATSQLVQTSVLPPEFAATYSFSHFNRLQSACFADLFSSDANLVIDAPTASGKTVLMEIAICRLFRDAAKRDSKKVLYLAPLKSLCAEKAADWASRYVHCGLRCAEVVGGDESGASVEIKSASQAVSQLHIVCTTPEKFVAVARGSPLANSAINLATICLVLIDECHMVGTSRGAFLELAISLIRSCAGQARIIAASATVGNTADIAEWLASCKSGPAKTLVFGEEYRPVPLTKVVLGYDCTGPYYQFQRNLDFKLPGIINTHGAGHSVLVFCPTRDCVPLGVAYHHAGLAANDRLRVEQLFINGAVQILCSTSTLGIGVNMPAYMVIVKGTKGYTNNNYEEYAKSEVLQFIGRAGRPQFGPSGKAVILTEKTMVSSYQYLVSGNEILESSLGPELVRWILGGVYRHEFMSTNDIVQW